MLLSYMDSMRSLFAMSFCMVDSWFSNVSSSYEGVRVCVCVCVCEGVRVCGVCKGVCVIKIVQQTNIQNCNTHT